MKMGYNQQAGARSEEIYNYIIEKEKYRKLKDNIPLQDLCFLLSIHFEELFYLKFPKQKLLKAFIDRLVVELIGKQKTPIKFVLGSHVAIQAYQKEILIHIYKRYRQKKYHFRFIEKSEDQLSMEKNKISCLPNLIQFLDSYVVCRMCKEAEEVSLPLKTIHDCFYVPILRVHELIPIYSGCIKNLIKMNFLKCLLEANDLLDNKKLLSLLKKIEWKEEVAEDLSKRMEDQSPRGILKF